MQLHMETLKSVPGREAASRMYVWMKGNPDLASIRNLKLTAQAANQLNMHRWHCCCCCSLFRYITNSCCS